MPALMPLPSKSKHILCASPILFLFKTYTRNNGFWSPPLTTTTTSNALASFHLSAWEKNGGGGTQQQGNRFCCTAAAVATQQQQQTGDGRAETGTNNNKGGKILGNAIGAVGMNSSANAVVQQRSPTVEVQQQRQQQKEEDDSPPRSTSSVSASVVSVSSPSSAHPLMDMFGRFHNYLRLSLVEKCNLRCQYCMPEEGVPLCPSKQLLTVDEIVRLSGLFARNGVDKVRLTGGEPTIRKDLVPIVRELALLPGIRQIGMTTNGVILGRLLPDLIHAGLTHLNISLDTLSPRKYAQITRRDAFPKVWSAIALAEQAFAPRFVKLNCVLQRGLNNGELVPLVELTRQRALDVRFIEFMPFAGNRFDGNKFMPYREMLAQLEAHYGEGIIERLQEDGPNETSKAYKVNGFRGQFGFITSMSEHFCGGCNRLRVTADGNLKICLHGRAEISLREPLRDGASDQELLEIIGGAVKHKAARHAGMEKLIRLADSLPDGRPMIRIGG